MLDSFGKEEMSVTFVHLLEIKRFLGTTSYVCEPTSVGLLININGEFDPGSGRTLAACLTHASRTVTGELAPLDQWRTGE